MTSGNKATFEALSPWAEASPRPVTGITQRVADPGQKRIGLFMNYKRAAPLIQHAVRKKLAERFPEAQFSEFLFRQNCDVSESAEAGAFEGWLKSLDTVIAAVGD
jgi:hypothetical protein